MHAGVSKLLTDAPCDVTKSRSSLLPLHPAGGGTLFLNSFTNVSEVQGDRSSGASRQIPKKSPKRHIVARRLTTGRWSLRTRGRIGRPAAAGTPRPPPAWAAGTECPMSRRGISEWPARSAESEDAEVGNAAKLVRPDKRTRRQFCVDKSLQHADLQKENYKTAVGSPTVAVKS